MIMQLKLGDIKAFLRLHNITDYSNLIILSGGLTFAFTHNGKRRQGFLSIIDGEIHLAD